MWWIVCVDIRRTFCTIPQVLPELVVSVLLVVVLGALAHRTLKKGVFLDVYAAFNARTD